MSFYKVPLNKFKLCIEFFSIEVYRMTWRYYARRHGHNIYYISCFCFKSFYTINKKLRYSNRFFVEKNSLKSIICLDQVEDSVKFQFLYAFREQELMNRNLARLNYLLLCTGESQRLVNAVRVNAGDVQEIYSLFIFLS